MRCKMRWWLSTGGALLVALMVTHVTCGESSKVDDTKPIVRIDSGEVQGSTLTSRERGRDFFAFMSIPYAEPPVGSKRFMPPERKKSWKGVFKANRKEVWCPQFGYTRKNDTEDCLVLNVYTPRISNESGHELMPVMVIFHEGGFLFGTGSYNFYRPEKLMDHDVVFVSCNYRLGILGFLNTEDASSPGNYGMLDQVLVLSWVRDNIQNFGGDPGRVTIFGNSAGGASVVYHMLSPLSTGLFHSAIAQSGSALIPGAYQSEPLQWAKRMANFTNCTTDSTRDMVACLRKKSVEDLFNARRYSELKYYQLYNVGPSIECSAGQGFLTGRPLDLARQGRINRVPFITGVVTHEGRFLIHDTMDFKKYNGTEFLDKEFCGFLANNLDVKLDSRMQEVCTLTKQEYFDGFDVENPEVLMSCLIKMFGDSNLCAGVSKTAELFSTAGVPSQAYMFNYVTEGNNSTGNLTDHGDEITLMLDRKWSKNAVINNTENDQKMGNVLNYIWTEFAVNQRNSIRLEPPGMTPITWSFYGPSKDSRKYLEINLNPGMKSGLLCDKMNFWMEQLVALKKI